MFHALHASELQRNIPAWSLAVAEYRTLPEDGIEALKHLRGEADCWPKPAYVLHEVFEEVNLWFE